MFFDNTRSWKYTYPRGTRLDDRPGPISHIPAYQDRQTRCSLQLQVAVYRERYQNFQPTLQPNRGPRSLLE